MNRLYETIKNIKGIDYRYWGFGKLSLIIGPKSDPVKVKEENILKLLGYLDNQEESDLKLYDEDRQKLVNSLSEDYQTNYLKLRKENLQTRLRRLEEGLQIKSSITFSGTGIIVSTPQPSNKILPSQRSYHSPSLDAIKEKLESKKKKKVKKSGKKKQSSSSK